MKIYISSSIANFKDKLLKRMGLQQYQDWKDRNESVIFFGLYHSADYKRFLLHRGSKRVFWCGSDILNLRDHPCWRNIIKRIKAKHFCENEVERDYLRFFGIESEIQPMLFDDPGKYQLSYKYCETPNVYVNCHVNNYNAYEIFLLLEYLVPALPKVNFHVYGLLIPSLSEDNNLFFHGTVSEEQFNEEIKGYQCGLRLNSFDGFSEILAKSVLMGQYPLSFISYPQIDNYQTFRELLKKIKDLKNMKESNILGREYWLNRLEQSLKAIMEE